MTKSRTLQVEQEHHRKAFELYYAQGGKRSYARLAEAMQISVATAKLWARSFDWRKRIGEREATVARQVADEAVSSAQQTQTRNRKLIELATSRLAKAMLNGQIKYQLADLDRLIRLQTFLEGGQAPVTLEAMSRMPHLEVVMLFNQWMGKLSDDDLRSLIAQLRAAGTRERTAGVDSPGGSLIAVHQRARLPAPPSEVAVPADGEADPDGIPK